MARMLFVLQTNEAIVTQSKPAFVLLGNPLLFDNMFVRPLVCLTCLFAPICLSLLVCSFVSLLSSCFFACLLACFL